MTTTEIHTDLFGSFEIVVCTKADKEAFRLKEMKASFNRQGEEFKQEFREFAINYAREHDTFKAEDIRAAYELSGKHQPVGEKKNKWKCTGAIINKLLREGFLENVYENGVKKFEYSAGGERQMAVYRRGPKC